MLSVNLVCYALVRRTQQMPVLRPLNYNMTEVHTNTLNIRIL